MTMQIGDELLYEGREIHINKYLLERYYKEFPEKKPDTPWAMTCLWRGYVATFEIRENQFFVNRIIKDSVETGEEADITHLVFPILQYINPKWYVRFCHAATQFQFRDKNGLLAPKVSEIAYFGTFCGMLLS